VPSLPASPSARCRRRSGAQPNGTRRAAITSPLQVWRPNARPSCSASGASDDTALEDARREAGRRGDGLLHDLAGGSRRALRCAEGDTGAGGRPVDRLAEEGVADRDRPRLRRRAAGRPRRGPRRQQELRDRRGLAGGALRLPPGRPSYLTRRLAMLAESNVLLIRHAEKPVRGKGLSPMGEARAEGYAAYFPNL